VVLISGYWLTWINLESSVYGNFHFILGGLYVALTLFHAVVSIYSTRFAWRRTIERILNDEMGMFHLVRLSQRATGWLVLAASLLVGYAGLEKLKLGIDWLIGFTPHIRYDSLLAVAIIAHSTAGAFSALKRRRTRQIAREVPVVSSARREAIIVMAGMALSIIGALYLDRIPRLADTIERVKGVLPPGQYEVWKLKPLHIDTVPSFDDESWDLKVRGLVENPLDFTLDEVRSLPRVESISDFHCVTRWTKFDNKWEGVRFSTIIRRARLLSTVKHVLILCEKGYSTNLPLSEVMGDDILLAYRLDDQELPVLYGGPLRLVVPHKYGYKSAKWVREIVFIDENELGYWEKRGYSDTADPFTEDRYSSG